MLAESDDPLVTREIAAKLEDAGLTLASKENFGASIDSPDSGLILPPREWSHVQTDDGRRVMAALVQSDELQRMILDSTLHYELAGVVETFPDNPILQAMAPVLWFRLREFQTFTPLEWPECPCPFDWRTEATKGIALAVEQPDPEDDRILYVASPPMTAVQGLVLPARRRNKVGRNDPCPCGTGIKFKRCCGA